MIRQYSADADIICVAVKSIAERHHSSSKRHGYDAWSVGSVVRGMRLDGGRVARITVGSTGK
jgi:hypothetical protein